MKTLWLLTAGLGLLYLAIWAAGNREVRLPDRPAATSQPGQVSGSDLAELAKGDAIARVDPQATLAVDSVKPGLFSGDDLRSGGTTPGSVVVLAARLDGKLVSKLTYHVAAPNRVVFVRQEGP